MDNNSFYKNQYVAIIADKMELKVHRHSTVQVVISMDATFSSRVNQTLIEEIQIILFNKFIPHSCFSNSRSLVFLIEPASLLGIQLILKLEKQNFITLKRNEQILSLVDTSRKSDFADPSLTDYLFQQFSLDQETNLGIIDDRILSSIDFIKRNIHQDIDLGKAANYVHLSEGRFRHLFNEQIGMPFSKYILWTKIKMVLINTLKNKMSFAEAAFHAGFCDQSHFSKVFVNTFGIAPNDLKKNSRFLQVYL
jgi:AraC-like DNA-binding protein